MKTQALAIAMVVAAGVTMFVMDLSVFSSLQDTPARLPRSAPVRRRVRLGETRTVTRCAEIARLPEVSAMEARVVTSVHT